MKKKSRYLMLASMIVFCTLMLFSGVFQVSAASPVTRRNFIDPAWTRSGQMGLLWDMYLGVGNGEEITYTISSNYARVSEINNLKYGLNFYMPPLTYLYRVNLIVELEIVGQGSRDYIHTLWYYAPGVGPGGYVINGYHSHDYGNWNLYQAGNPATGVRVYFKFVYYAFLVTAGGKAYFDPAIVDFDGKWVTLH